MGKESWNGVNKIQKTRIKEKVVELGNKKGLLLDADDSVVGSQESCSEAFYRQRFIRDNDERGNGDLLEGNRVERECGQERRAKPVVPCPFDR